MAARRSRVSGAARAAPRATARVIAAPDAAAGTPAGGAPADGAPPAAALPALSSRPRVFFQGADGAVVTDLDEAAVVAALAADEGRLWVDIDARSDEQHAWLQRVFHFHPLAIEDTLNPSSRVKYDEYPEFLFVIVRGVRFDESTDDPYDLTTANLCFFLGPRFLVTVHRTDSSVCDEAAAHLLASPDLMARGAGRLMHAMIDLSVDRYFPLLDQLDDFIDQLEERVLVQQQHGVIQDIFSVKRTILDLRRHLVPQREVLNALTNRPSAFLSPELQVYFRDVYDHVLRITDSLDTYREMLSSTLESSLSQASNRLATATKTLSVLATMSIPFVMVSGMWGMNFARVPLADHPYGFWLMLLLQLGLGLAVVVVLRVLRLL